MKHTQEEIINALNVIKDTCSNVSNIQDCWLCPLSDRDGHCIITEQSPQAWDIVREEEVWRAFK